MIGQLRRFFDMRSVGVLPFLPPSVEAAPPESGIAHNLILVEKQPELLHRFRSLRQLKKQFSQWRAGGWAPDAVLVYNLSPIYNQFLLWLRRQQPCPKLVLLLLDSTSLGQPVPRFKQFRRRFKPMFVPDNAMLPRFDACIGLSESVAKYFRPRRVPFLWMPGGCTPARARHENPTGNPDAETSRLRFGYFGALGSHSGLEPFLQTFLAQFHPGTKQAWLEIWGYGKMDERLGALASQPPIKFQGLISPAECLRLGRRCDVLVNPRPTSHGNENNFASKLFEYALMGRAILTSDLSGVKAVLGPEAYYFHADDFSSSLSAQLAKIAATSRAELNRRGAAIQQRVVTSFSWQKQGARMAQFIAETCGEKWEKVEAAEAIAA